MFGRMIVCGVTMIAAGMLWANQAEPAGAKPKAAATRPARATTRPATRPATRPVHRDVKVEEFERLMSEKKYAVLDVRTKAEFVAGHIPGAINIDVNDPQFEQKIAKLKKDTPYLVQCRSGARSTRACEKMTGLGFKELYNLEGGILAWQKQGKEVVTE
jgi:phage shock protein E